MRPEVSLAPTTYRKTNGNSKDYHKKSGCIDQGQLRHRKPCRVSAAAFPDSSEPTGCAIFSSLLFFPRNEPRILLTLCPII
jgi:hypothetical protein